MDRTQIEELMTKLEKRFLNHMNRHVNIKWEEYLELLIQQSILEIVAKMEDTGGEPDLIVIGEDWFIVDCSKETPKDRVSICYDEDARKKRKQYPPDQSAESMAQYIGVELVDETLYAKMQAIEPFDLKTSSWLKTPQEIRDLGGALFGDRRYNRVFTYHNGADSYYNVRGFRGYKKVR